jgi:prepilin-type N-terminal cleavage/methylation domain-containing protein
LHRGFTLIEILVVIAIIGLIAGTVTAALNSARAKGRDARRLRDIKQVAIALEQYADATGAYPVQTTATAGAAAAVLGTALSSLSPTYIDALPADPQSPTYKYYYVTSASGLSYCIGIRLENAATRSGCAAALTTSMNTITASVNTYQYGYSFQ